jgi:hypothetical protein
MGVPHAAYLLICWSASSKQVWRQSGGMGALLVSQLTWHGEALCGLGVWDVWVLLLLCGFILPSVVPASQQDF